MKIHVFPFQIGKVQSTKNSWLNLLPFDKMSSTISLRPLKKIVVIVSFVPMACRVLGMKPAGDRSNIFDDGQD
jgi:hypothetical protein